MDRYVLAQTISPRPGNEWRLRQGAVVSVQSDYTATVTIAGADTQISGVRYVGQPPVPGGGAWLWANDTDLFIAGAISASGGTLAPRVYRTTNQTVTSGSITPVSWDAADGDGFGVFSAGSPTVVTLTVPGRYAATAQIDFASNGTGLRSASVIAGGTVVGALSIGAFSGVARLNVQSVPFTVSASTTVEVQVEQTSGGGLDVVASGSVSPGLGVYYLGA